MAIIPLLPIAGTLVAWNTISKCVVRFAYAMMGLRPPPWSDPWSDAWPHVGATEPLLPTESNSSVPEHRRKFQYCPLRRDEIRILILYPGSRSDPLRGHLEIANLSARPTYDALSYTWADENGNADRSKWLLCSNEGGVIPITSNCEAAMRCLQLHDSPRKIWVDAVCINQESDTERTCQVSLMSRIFTNARQVVAYTGEGTPQTDLLFSWLNGLGAEYLDMSFNHQFDDAWSGILTDLERFWIVGQARLLSFVHGPATTQTNTAISEPELVNLSKDYLCRRWFKRVWVLQEVALPNINHISIVCGGKTTTAIRAFHVLSMLRNSNSASMLRIFILLRKRTRRPRKSYLLDILIETRDREAADSRDKIFGVLSIAHELDGKIFPELLANYDKAAHEVYTDYSTFFIQHHGPGFFLSLIKSPPLLPGLPSWAADWTVPWPNHKAIDGKDFAAAQISGHYGDPGTKFHKDGVLCILTLVRPRIHHGYFTRDGHIDGVNFVQTEDAAQLENEFVLIEIYPGLAALLKRNREQFVFVRVCPHALTEGGVHELVGRWSSVVIDRERPKDTAIQDHQPLGYLGGPETFMIQ
ncbi:heterokaryon incompatibility protein-domain-containing protein [Cadophora sp. MPI-SDFR-AT-0126]|nr:heterokaryon incompatibility protein-domain-containing protein [Leotiomycetes sp. MPI-SDFR-AT-0126]